MSNVVKIVIIVALIISVGAVIILKQDRSLPIDYSGTGLQPSEVSSQSGHAPSEKPLPHLLDLGAGKCIPCKLMAPILEELKRQFAGTMQVEFLDVHKNPDLITKYSVSIIPTQIFFDASGKELFRHEGFMSKEDILAKWKELGVDFAKTE